VSITRPLGKSLAQNAAPDAWQANAELCNAPCVPATHALDELLQVNEALRQEMTERKQAQAERDRLFTLSLDLLALAGLDGYLKHINPAWERMFGYTQADLLAKPFVELVYADDREAVLTEIQKLTTGLNTVSFEVRLICADGTYRWTSWNVTPFAAEGLLYGVGRDITAHKQIQEAYHRLVEHSLQGLAILQDFRIVFANPTLAQISGYTMSELLTLSPDQIQALVHKDDQALVFGHLQNCLVGKRTPVHFGFRFIRKDGVVRWVEKYASQIEYQGRTAVQIAYLDMTERKEAEDEKALLLAAVSQQRTELHALTAQLAAVQEAERRELARELHDQVGQNLSALGFNLHFIRKQISYSSPPGTVIWTHLNDSLTLVEQTGERIRDVLAELRPPMLDVCGLVDALEWYAQRFAARFGLTLTFQSKPPLARLAPLVENALFRIVQEALNNIAKHAQATAVTLTLAEDDLIVRLMITDNGIGFASPCENGIPKRQGWGLRIMRERATMIGGRGWVESAPGQGTRVIIEVPQ